MKSSALIMYVNEAVDARVLLEADLQETCFSD